MSQQMILCSPIPGPKKTAERLVQSLKWLAIAMVLMVFVLSILALIGTQFFMGVLKHKCVISSPSGRMDTPTTEQPEYFVTHNETINFYDNFVFEDYINKVGKMTPEIIIFIGLLKHFYNLSDVFFVVVCWLVFSGSIATSKS